MDPTTIGMTTAAAVCFAAVYPTLASYWRAELEGDVSTTSQFTSHRGMGRTTHDVLTKLRLIYLVGYTLMCSADWFQGPYLYAMYDGFSLSVSDVYALYSMDYIAAAILGIGCGVMSDVVGARTSCLLYGVLYAVACLCNHWPASFAVLTAGCVIDGICNALLHSSFETWVARKHDELIEAGDGSADQRATIEGRLSQVLAGAALSSHCASVVVGGITCLMVNSMGLPPVTTMDCAVVLLVLGTTYIYAFWPDDVVEQQQQGKAENSGTCEPLRRTDTPNIRSLAHRVCREIASTPGAATLLVLESIFSGVTLYFISCYQPLIAFLHGRRVATVNTAGSVGAGGDIFPFGTYFSILMVCMTLGSAMYANLVRSGAAWQRNVALLAQCHALGSFCCLLAACGPVLADSVLEQQLPSWLCAGDVGLAASCVGLAGFEVACGFQEPCLAALHGQLLTDLGCRGTVVSIARFAGNLLAIAMLAFAASHSISASWAMAAGALLTGALVAGLCGATVSKARTKLTKAA